MICSNCGTENKATAKFCGGCGAALAATCAACGAAHEPGLRFCNDCGAPLGETAAPAEAPPAPTAERRVVSVLFADLVGFTTLSESRDSEEVRELLSRYFDASRRLIELYGGTIEKFIGDAVMAVWGTPVATEDDAERAVRAALDLVAAVSALGQEQGAENLRARVGVLTGEAAVTIGAEGQGMVAGDLVNTASRIQSVAEPGTGARRRGNAPRQRAGDRLRGGGPARAQGQGRAGRAVAGGPNHLRAPGRAAIGRPGGAVRRSRPGASARQGAVPRVGRGAQGAPRLGDRNRRNRQVAARLGVLQVLRRARRQRLLASRSLPRLRRGGDLLGAGGHGAHAGADRRGRRTCVGAREITGDPVGDDPRRRGTRASSSRASPSCSASRTPSQATAPTSSPPGGSSSSGSPTPTRRCSCSRTSSGRTRACSTSSSTCSNGRAPRRCSSSRSHDQSSRNAGRAGERDFAASRRSTSNHWAKRRCPSCSTGSCPASPPTCTTRSSDAQRACPSMRSRRCACCSTAGC